MENKEVKVIKNTLFMFLRMFFVMFLTLFSTRILLKFLGVNNYGIYDLIFGIVIMFNVIGGAMATTLQRFYNVSVGNPLKTSKIYNVSLQIFILIGVIVFCLGYFSSNYIVSLLSIPYEYKKDSEVFFKLCILNLVFLILRIPYVALLISHEKMGIYSLVSICDAILKFIGIVLLSNYFYDQNKLITYGVIMCLVSFFVTFMYVIICYEKIKIPKIVLRGDKEVYREIMSFSGWTLFGSTASLYSQQGISILINKFFGISVNATNAITQQVYNAVFQFVNSFQVAFNPYLMKTYAENNIDKVNTLIILFTKVSIFLYLLIAIPLAIFLKPILLIWLGIIPDYSYIFIIITLLVIVFEVLSTPLWVLVQSSGNIKRYQIIISSILIINIPFAWILIKNIDHPALIFISKIVISISAFGYRLIKIKELTNISIRKYSNEILYPLIFLILCVGLVVFYCKSVSFTFIEIAFGFFCIMFIYVMLYYMVFLGKKDKEKMFKYFDDLKGRF